MPGPDLDTRLQALRGLSNDQPGDQLLLLLSAQSKVELSQDEFYQEIKLRSILA